MSFFKTLLASIVGFFISLAILTFISIGMIAAVISSAGTQPPPTVADHSVLVVPLSGSISEYVNEDPFAELSGKGPALSLREVIAKLEQAGSDDRIDGIWLQLDDYTGSWAQAEEIRTALLGLKSSGKFMYATSGANGYTEKDYFLASTADSIIMNPAGNMELNGISATLTFFKPLLDRIGVKPEVVRAGSYKSAVEPFVRDSASPENREMTQALVNSIFSRFTTAVRESRKMSQADLDTIINSRALLTAEEALLLRLVDALMYDDEVQKLLEKRTGVTDDEDDIESVTINQYVPRASDDVEDEGEEDGGNSQIALVYAVGEITSGESRSTPNPLFGGGTVGSETFIEAMQTARESERVKAVVVRVESPGGEAPASEAMWREVVLTREKKPVIISMGGVAASGGYFIAAAGDTIVAEPSTLTGSIGVFGLFFNAEQLLEEEIGINTQTINSNPNADMFSFARPANELERRILEKNIDTVYRTFLRIVAQGRNMPIDQVDSIAQGRVWTGEQAQKIGLVDILGGLDSAISIAATRAGLKADSYTIRTLPRKKTIFEAFADIIETSSVRLFSSDSPIERYHAVYEWLASRPVVQARSIDIRID